MPQVRGRRARRWRETPRRVNRRTPVGARQTRPSKKSAEKTRTKAGKRRRAESQTKLKTKSKYGASLTAAGNAEKEYIYLYIYYFFPNSDRAIRSSTTTGARHFQQTLSCFPPPPPPPPRPLPVFLSHPYRCWANVVEPFSPPCIALFQANC